MKRLLLASTLVAAAACGSDKKSITGPGDADCASGSVGVNQAITATLTASDCKIISVLSGDPVDSAYYRSYAVQLTQGQRYVISARAAGGTWDPVMALVGGTTAQPTIEGVSDDEGGGFSGLDPELVFVAPATGTYSIFVGGYDDQEMGQFRLSVRSCGGGSAATVGTMSGQSLSTGDCIVHVMMDSYDSTYADVYSVTLAQNEGRKFIVSSTSFTPDLAIGGPGVDFCYYNSCDTGQLSGQSSDTIYVFASQAGTYTLIVGAETFGQTGAYTLETRNAVTAGAATVAPRSLSAPGVGGVRAEKVKKPRR